MDAFYDEHDRKIVYLYIVRKETGTIARHEFDSKEQARQYLQDNQKFLREYLKPTKYRAYIKSKIRNWTVPLFHVDFESQEAAREYVEKKAYSLEKIKEVPVETL